MFTERSIILILFLILIVAGLGSALIKGEELNKNRDIIVVTNFEECVRGGYSVMESYPRQCITPDGKRFIENINKQPVLKNGDKECIPTGCNNQLCVSADIAPTITSTCEFREEYACYRKAVCELQEDKQCGWTMNKELRECLKL